MGNVFIINILTHTVRWTIYYL